MYINLYPIIIDKVICRWIYSCLDFTYKRILTIQQNYWIAILGTIFPASNYIEKSNMAV